MYSVRRAALRAASSSVRAAAAVPRQQIASFAVHVSKVNTKPAATLRLARSFSQTPRVANEESADQDPPPAKKSDFPADTHTSIYISNMTFDATEVHLKEAFSQYGEIEDIRIVKDGRGLSRGFGFIRFATEESAKRAVESADRSFWHGRRINVKPREQPTDETRTLKPPTTSVFIGNIPYETSDADLNAVFKTLENVKDVRVAIDRATGWPRGFAHADFHDVESAIKAVEKLNDVELGSRRLRCDYAEPRQQTAPRQSSNNFSNNNDSGFGTRNFPSS